METPYFFSFFSVLFLAFLYAFTLQPERDIKTVLKQLTGDGYEWEQQCWEETELAILRQRGQETGLAAYLQEVKEYLLPVVEQR
ncbi:MAG: hypothetical protein ACPGVO_08225 [Spirulinaceae cyanobacterium]